MRVAVIGSRTLSIQNLHDDLPPDVTEIISGGAQGIDFCAHTYAIQHQIPLREFFPQYEKSLGGCSAGLSFFLIVCVLPC